MKPREKECSLLPELLPGINDQLRSLRPAYSRYNILFYFRAQFISHDSRKSLIETEYGMTFKPSTWGNPTSNAILEQIHQVLWNIVWDFNIKETYVDEDYPWLGILSEAAFVIC